MDRPLDGWWFVHSGRSEHPAHNIDAPDYLCERCPEPPNLGEVMIVEGGEPGWVCEPCAKRAAEPAVPMISAAEALACKPAPFTFRDAVELGGIAAFTIGGLIVTGHAVIWAFRAGAWLSLQAIDFVDNVGRSLGW